MRPRPLAAALLATLLAGCIIVELPMESAGAPQVDFPDPPPSERGGPHPRDAGNLVMSWGDGAAGRHAAYRDALVEQGEFEGWVDALNAMLALPYDVPVRHATCGMENAYYDFEAREVVLCWELLDLIAYVMDEPGLAPEEHAAAVGSAWLFVFIHEVGHALVDAYDLPITGREEDAVDDLATLALIDAGASDAAVQAAVFWILTENGVHSQARFADEHSLNAQRFYAILCTVYGSDPEGHAWLVREGYLPAQRGERCLREYRQKDAAWDTLLEPWRVDA